MMMRQILIDPKMQAEGLLGLLPVECDLNAVETRIVPYLLFISSTVSIAGVKPMMDTVLSFVI
jgi:hypothetical protein